MFVRDCMTKNVKLTSPTTTATEAARIMRDGDFGMLPVGDGDRLVGMITDRDIAIRGVAEGKDPNTATVRDIMSTKVLYCYDDDDTTAVAKNMGENRVRRLPVLNREKRLVGIISLGDIAVSQESNLQITADAFRAISRNGSDQVAATA